MAKRRSDKFEVAPRYKGRPQPGEIREATAPREPDRIGRALEREQLVQQEQFEEAQEGKPGPGEVFYAENAQKEERDEKDKLRDFLHLARERFRLAADATARLRSEALDDLQFRAGEQWPQDIQKQRQIDGRPMLTMNRLPQFIRQVTNEQRQNRPAIEIRPVGDGATMDTAEVLQGVVRHIEVISDADVVYDTAFDHMVTSGFGYWRLLTEYVSDDSFDQEIYIKRIKNPFNVYVDPSSVEADESDARFKFIIEDIPRLEYATLYPGSEAASLAEFRSLGDNGAEWVNKETIRVAEYFHIEEQSYTKCLLSTGEIVKKSEMPEDAVSINERQCIERKVIWTKINAVEKLDERTLPGDFIPVIPVLADDLDINGKRHLAGMVRNAKDPQRMYNYWLSAATEMIALAPRAPFVAAEGQLEGHETEWEQANSRNFAALTYKPTSVGGSLVPPPQRNVYEPPVQSINLMTRQSDADLKAIMGIYEPTLGQAKQEQSGKAISLLQRQADVSNSNWMDNLARSLRHTGRVLLQWIPKYYDTARVQRIIKPDGEQSYVILHNGQDSQAQQLLSQNIQKIYDVGVGRYDVTVAAGPSYQTKRQEAVAGQLALVQSFPQVFAVIGDMLVRNMDWPQAREMSQRLKKMLPPGVLEDDGDPQTKLAILQQQMQAMMQQHAALTETVNKQNDVIQQKQLEAQTRMETTRMQTETQLAVAEINTKSQELNERLAVVGDMLKQFHISAHELGLEKIKTAREIAVQKLANKAPKKLTKKASA